MYCGNVHPCTSVEELIAQVELHLLPIKRARKLKRMHLGLWLNQSLLSQLCSCDKLRTQWFELLSEHNLTIKSLNAFPQTEFHGKEIKELVYFPEWCQQSRLDYTKLLADFIALYPAVFVQNITISTVPLGYKASWNSDKQKSAIKNLGEIANYLAAIKQDNGIHIRLCLEMEPDCQLESSAELIDFFKRDLKIDTQVNNASHLGACYDICHQAVMFEDIISSLVAIEENNIVIGKIQVSNAMSFKVVNLAKVQSKLKRFNRSPYLHQMKVQSASGIVSFPDLDFNLLNKFSPQEQVRIHFHLPINSHNVTEELETTQNAILEVVSMLASMKNKPDLEIETYTWLVMVDALGLNECLIKELNWLEKSLTKLNLIIN